MAPNLAPNWSCPPKTIFNTAATGSFFKWKWDHVTPAKTCINSPTKSVRSKALWRLTGPYVIWPLLPFWPQSSPHSPLLTLLPPHKSPLSRTPGGCSQASGLCPVCSLCLDWSSPWYPQGQLHNHLKSLLKFHIPNEKLELLRPLPSFPGLLIFQ